MNTDRPIRVAVLGAAPPSPGLAEAQVHETDSPAALAALCRRGRVDLVVLAEGRWPQAEVRLAEIDPSMTVLRHASDQGICSSIVRQAAQLRIRSRDQARRSYALVRQTGVDPLPGESEAMAGLRARLRQLVDTTGVVTIAGAPGTPLLAACCWLHDRARGGPLLQMDMRSADAKEKLLGSAAGPGALPLAAGGTLVLQHIEAARGPMVDVLVQLAGGIWFGPEDDQPRLAGARLIATLERDPADPGSVSTAAGVPEGWTSKVVRVPTLQERRMDVPLLVSLRHGIQAAGADLGLDQDYPWPGNDAELDLRCQLAALVARPTGMSSSLVCDQGRSLADLERQAVVATLRSQGGHRRRTAEALGIGLRTLGVKLSHWRSVQQLPPGI